MAENKNIGASVYDKLKAQAKASGLDMQSLVRLYAQQRLLYRISICEAASSFCLKGGLMLAAYNNGDVLRPTEDIDFNGFGDGGIEEIEATIRMAISTPVPDDGVTFDLDTMKTLKDREGIIPGGKVVLTGKVHTARIQIRVDVGFRNVITPDAMPMEIPTLLPEVVPCPVIAGYPLETIISEKLHAIAQFGNDNTRHKDYYDIWRIQNSYEIEGRVLSRAIANTFEHQGRIIDPNMPGLSDDFGRENERAWRAFLRKTNLKDDMVFVTVIAEIREFIVPAMSEDIAVDARWVPNEGWDGLGNNYLFSVR